MKQITGYFNTILELQKKQTAIKEKISKIIQTSIGIYINPNQIELDGLKIKYITSSVIRMFLIENQTKINKEIQTQGLEYKI